MSLKAKIEAVIYASEEPVTLAQLTGLLGEEGQAELDALATQQQSLALEAAESTLDATGTQTGNDADALNAEILDIDVYEEDAVIPSDTGNRGEPEEDLVILSGAEAQSHRASAESKEPDAASPSTTAPSLPNPETPEPSAPDPKAEILAAKQKERRLRDYFRSLLDQLIADYANGDRGLEVREVASGFRLGTKPEYHDAVRGFVKSLKPPLKLTLQALETLAVVAYKQPVTAPEVSEIRGVDSAGVLGSLMSRKLVIPAGRKQVIGRPILYKTTKDFLLRFGLKDVNELPSIEEFEKMAGELNETLLDEVPDQAPETEAPEEAPMEAPEQANKVPDNPPAASNPPAPGNVGGSPSVDEINSAPEPTHAHHDTTEDLLSDKSAHLEGQNREHADRNEVDPQESEHDA